MESIKTEGPGGRNKYEPRKLFLELQSTFSLKMTAKGGKLKKNQGSGELQNHEGNI